MIFVTVGTNEAPFDRLVDAAADLERHHEVVIQYGASGVRPVSSTWVDFLPFEAIVNHVRRADAVITHAGVGSIMVCLINGKAPIVVPRLRCFGEAVDDHQLLFARRFELSGLVRLVEDPDDLRNALRTHTSGHVSASSSHRLAHELHTFIGARTTRTRGTALRRR